LLGTLLLAFGTCTRSNGILMSLVIGFEQLRRIISSWIKAVDSNRQPPYGFLLLWIPVQTLFFALIVVCPYFVFQWLGYQQFCLPQDSGASPDWCLQTIPSIYSYIQDQYWNVGFLKYWQLKQIPNFLLAVPAVYAWQKATFQFFRSHWLSSSACCKGFRDILRNITDKNSLPMSPSGKEIEALDRQQLNQSHLQARLVGLYVQWSILTLMAIFIINVQVLTRLAAGSCPCFYWALASLFTSNNRQVCLFGHQRSLRSYVITYCYVYFFVGIILHSNFLPWT